jgi:hypothetical protein
MIGNASLLMALKKWPFSFQKLAESSQTAINLGLKYSFEKQDFDYRPLIFSAWKDKWHSQTN